jgi:hypothetical protein
MNLDIALHLRIASFLVAASFFVMVRAADSSQVSSPALASPGYSLYGDSGVPDISGEWLGTFSSSPGDRSQIPLEDRDITPWAPWPAPLTPPYRKMADERVAAAKKGRQLGDLGARCLPIGQAEITIGLFPHEIIQTLGEVSIWFWGQGRPLVIWTDGRPHPKDLAPSYVGHSIGHWDGDILFVDTVGILSTTPIDPGTRTPHSGKLHIKWSIQRVAPDVLHAHVTLYDAEACTEPMVVTAIWRRKSGPEWQMLDDASCFENNRNEPDAEGATSFKKF